MKILVIRLSSIGDIVLTSPVVRCLKEQIPNAEIHYLTKDVYGSLLENNPHISKLFTLQHSIKDTVDELGEERYTYVVDLHKNTRSRLIRQNLGTKSISFNKLNFRKWLFVNFKINALPKKHIVDRYFDALRHLGVENDGQGLEVHLPEKSENLPIDIPSTPFIAVAIGGTYTTKQPKLKTLQALINRLNSPVVLLGGGKQDSERADELSANPSPNIINAVNKLSLLQSAFVISQAHEVITGDTGLMHIAAAFKKPIQVLWGNTHPSFGMYPYPLNNKVVMHMSDLKCHPCSKLGYNSCPRGHFKCMNHNPQYIVENLHSIQPKQ